MYTLNIRYGEIIHSIFVGLLLYGIMFFFAKKIINDKICEFGHQSV